MNQFARPVLLALVLALHAAPQSVSAGIVTLDFESINLFGASSFNQGDYRFTSSGPNGFWTRVNGPGSIGARSVFDNTVFATTTLSRLDSAAFTLHEIVLAELNANNPGPTVTFVGQLSAGGTVSQSFTLTGGAINTHQFTFSGFTDVTSVRWTQGSPSQPIYHQFDNIVVEHTPPPPPPDPDPEPDPDPPPTTGPPESISASAQYGVRNSTNSDPNGAVVTNPGAAEVGNTSGGSSPDVRGIAEFALDDASLVEAASATLSFKALFPYLDSVGPASGSDGPFPIVIEAFAANGLGSVGDFQAVPLSTVATFDTSSIVAGEILTFDVTDLYNAALGNGTGLGFRLRQQNELDDGRNVGYTFGNFGLSLEYATQSEVPEPSSLALFGAGLVGLGATVPRRRRTVSGDAS